MKALNSYRTKNRNLETGVEMEKYSVLLVDDEEDVIQIIMKKMDWESMGFQIVGYAHNGVEALEMAVRRIAAKEIKGLIHHSDRGVQYASADYIAILRHNGILPSMTEDGNPKDNAIAERVNGIIKNELLQGMRFSSIQEVRKAVATAVHFYNNERPHMSLDMLTPVQAGEMQGPIRKRWISYREKYLNVALA